MQALVADGRLATKKVLLVEDQPIVREIVATMLSAIGFGTVAETKNGEEAWRYITDIRQPQPDLIVTDLYMPVLSGSDLIQRVRKSTLPHFKTLPIIVLTGDSKYSGFNHLEGHSVSGCLIKPIKAADLKAAIELALRQSVAA